LNWKGDENILHNPGGDVAIVTVNPHGKVNPVRPNMQQDHESRLPHLTALIGSGLVDVVVCPECWLDDGGRRSVASYLKSSGNQVKGFVAPTSSCVCTMEERPDTAKIAQSVSGGVLILLSPSLAARVRDVKTFAVAGSWFSV
jgi:hypothetical protein